jgi:hypothetical protein
MAAFALKEHSGYKPQLKCGDVTFLQCGATESVIQIAT